MDTAERTGTHESSTVYDGFISYSHAADDLLAPRLQSGLQRFAKPWWKRRALRIFRDESSLSANPHLWSSITEALDQSGWFVLLLSPDAAESEWVNQEIEYWKEHKDPSRILPVLTDGTFEWSGGDISGTAVPEQLQGSFTEEPRWVDFRFAKDETDLDLKDPRFADAVADIASAVQGIPKDELASEEVKQHRRTIRTAWAGAALVGLLAVAATGFAFQSAENAERAEEEATRANQEADRAEASAEAEAEARDQAELNAQRAEVNAQLAKSRELAAAATSTLERDPELATLLALKAIDRAPGGSELPVELVNAIWQAGSSNRLIDVIETGYDGHISLSPDGSRLAATVSTNALRMYDTDTHDVIWEYSEDTVDSFVYPVIGPDGRTALPVFDSAAEWAGPVEESDELPNRIVILDSDGGVEASLEFRECDTAGNLDWSADGSYLAVSFLDSCRVREGFPQWVEVFRTDEWTPVAFRGFEGVPLGLNPRFAEDGRLFLLRSFESTLILSADTFELANELDSTGIGDISADGGRIFGFYTNQGFSGEAGTQWSVLSFRSDDGTLQDILYTQIGFPAIPFGATATEDGNLIVTGRSRTLIYDIKTGEEKRSLPTGPVETVGYDSERQLLYTSGSDDGPRVWDLGASSVGVTQTGELGDYSWINGNHFKTGPSLGAFWAADLSAASGKSVFFDLQTGEFVGEVADSVPHAALANGRFLLYMQEEEGEADALYDPESGELIRFFECADFDPDLGCEDPGYNIAVSLDGTEIYAYPYSENDPNALTGEVLTLDPETGQILASEIPGRFPLVIETFTDDWVLGSPTSRIDYRVIDRQMGETLWVDEIGQLRSIQSSDGSWFATFNGPDGVQLVDTETWESFFIEGPVHVRGGSFNADASLLAVGDLESLRIIDVESGLIAQQLRLPGVSDVHWIDDETLIVGTKEGIFGLLSISTEEMIARTRSSLRRSFTEQECLTYRIDPCPTLDEIRSR